MAEEFAPNNNLLDNLTTFFINTSEFLTTPAVVGAGGRGSSKGPVQLIVPSLAARFFIFLNRFVIPVFGVCGICGNLLNIVVFLLRYRRRDIDLLERVALWGLMALALSDLCFCICIVPNNWLNQSQTIFFSRDFALFYQLYATYFLDLFLKISTWLTAIVAVSRYVGICMPLKARAFTRLTNVRLAIASTCLLWACLLVPNLLIFTVIEIGGSGGSGALAGNATTVYYVMGGQFTKSKSMKLFFTYFWAGLGFLLPVGVVVFCDVQLIRAVRRSRDLCKANFKKPALTQPAQQAEGAERSGSQGGSRKSQERLMQSRSRSITSTLVALMVMMLVLVSPSEFLWMISEFVKSEKLLPIHEMVTVAANTLLTANFAFHFVMYCAVNQRFRRSVVACVKRCCSAERSTRRTSYFLEHNSARAAGAGRNTSHGAGLLLPISRS